MPSILYTIMIQYMRTRAAGRQSKPYAETSDFNQRIVDAAGVYQRQLVDGSARGYMPVEVAAFVAGACWARQLLASEKEISL
jgi:hypothetical protein